MATSRRGRHGIVLCVSPEGHMQARNADCLYCQAKCVVVGTLNSLSDVALAVYGSNVHTPVHSAESFVDDGSGPNRHIPGFLRQAITPASVLDVIHRELPNIDIDEPAYQRAAVNLYGLWCCPDGDCDYFLDAARVRADELAFIRQYDVGSTFTSALPSGFGRIVSGNPMGARAVLQLLAYWHFEVAHLGRRGVEMVVAPTMRTTDSQVCSRASQFCVSVLELTSAQQVVSWRWKPDWVEIMPDIQAAAAQDEQGLTHAVRHWLSEKGARVCNRLRRPYWVKYRLWARADRAHRKELLRSALDVGQNEHDAVLRMFTECRLEDLTERNAEAFEAHAQGEALDRDVDNFRLLTVRPWPRAFPTWEGLSDAERNEIMTVYATGDHDALLSCERRIYHYPWLCDW